jgi:hypothetical protein
LSILNNKELEIPHPEDPSASCHVCASAVHDISNFVFLKDADGRNRFCIIQGIEFIEAIVTEQNAYIIAAQDTDYVQTQIGTVRSKRYQGMFEHDYAYDGILIYSNRPFHFFYDQLLNLPAIWPDLETSHKAIYVDDNAFCRPDEVFNIPTLRKKDGAAYFTASLFPRQLKLEDFFVKARQMESSLYKCYNKKSSLSEEGAINVWYGVTGSKRSWVEQIEGALYIAERLLEKGIHVRLYVDGMTAALGKYSPAQEDISILNELMGRLDPRVEVLNQIGLDYPTKIANCSACSVFVTNAGTGSFVPLRVCTLGGVLHSNTRLFTFEGDSYSTIVRRVDPRYIADLGDGSLQEQHTSYSIHPEVIWSEVVAFASEFIKSDPTSDLAATLQRVTSQ